MSALTRAALKLFFETGDLPTEAQFADLIDSSPNIQDDLGDAPADVRAVKVALSSAQILALNTTPIQMIAAPGAGLAIQVIGAFIDILFNTAAYVANPNFNLITNTATIQQFTHPFVFTASIATLRGLDHSLAVGAADTQIIANQALNAFTLIGDPTVGDSPANVYITYRIITI